MKNLHVLPTPKPSRLFIIYGRLYNYHKPQQGNGINQINYHIYITSDQEPKEGDWVFDTFRNAYPIIRQLKTEEEVLGVQETEFKIILTTDPDLIKDSVQSIDDEFLEWFVKNPSCEEVDVMTDAFTVKEMSMLPLGIRNLKYKIIIPQEEPNYNMKEEILVEMERLQKEEPKQFTLEEAADKYSQELLEAKTIQPHEKTWIKSMFIYIANWQAKNMYSEIHLILENVLYWDTCPDDFKEDIKKWLNDYKQDNEQ
jgi:hypothetical protein